MVHCYSKQDWCQTTLTIPQVPHLYRTPQGDGFLPTVTEAHWFLSDTLSSSFSLSFCFLLFFVRRRAPEPLLDLQHSLSPERLFSRCRAFTKSPPFPTRHLAVPSSVTSLSGDSPGPACKWRLGPWLCGACAARPWPRRAGGRCVLPSGTPLFSDEVWGLSFREDSRRQFLALGIGRIHPDPMFSMRSSERMHQGNASQSHAMHVQCRAGAFLQGWCWAVSGSSAEESARDDPELLVSRNEATREWMLHSSSLPMGQ